jgi:multicomponent Na+:H+ antiporter subunit B
MNTIILRTLAPLIVTTMLVFSAYICLRGHNEPGGGFIGGLIAASSFAVLGIARGARSAREAFFFDPLAVAAAGFLLSALSGVVSIFQNAPFLTGIWLTFELGESTITLSTPMLFDIGVYLVVLGTFVSVGLGLEEEED